MGALHFRARFLAPTTGHLPPGSRPQLKTAARLFRSASPSQARCRRTKGAFAIRKRCEQNFTKKRRELLETRVEASKKRLRKLYPELHGKTLDFVSHAVEEQVLFISIRFTDGTDFSLRFACEMLIEGADLSDVRTGNFKLIRDYIKRR